MTFQEFSQLFIVNQDIGIPVNSGHSVYILLQEDIIVYVGITKSPYTRFQSHQKEKSFDRIVIFRSGLTKKDADKLETLLIRAVNPGLNKAKKKDTTIKPKNPNENLEVNASIFFEGSSYKDIASFKGTMRKLKSRGKYEKYRKMKQFLNSFEGKSAEIREIS